MTGRKLLVVAALLVVALPLAASRRRSVRTPEFRHLTANEWIRATAVPFATTDARTGTRDLEPLREIVGDARIVSLGEATHGSREFFTMKHRVLEYLVEEMGFTIFAIEANLPEADVVDDYVLHGKGDSREALKGMYFWTWNTAEVLDMIEWMREYNLRRGDRPPVRFRGFDPQYAPWAVDKVTAYVAQVDPDAASAMTQRLACIRREPSPYRALPQATRDACAASIQQAMSVLSERRADYSARSTAADFENHLRYLRVIQQSESIWSNRGQRDNFMAENVAWLVDTAHPGEKAVLWAHNFHVSADFPNRMGYPLKQRFGDDIVIAGFAFAGGSFKAYGPNGFGTYSTTETPPAGWEPFFREAGTPLFILDLRNTRRSPEAAEYLTQSRRLWTVGSLWQPANLGNHRVGMALRPAYDVLIYIENVTPTAILPF
ncbi:MAG TPA: erythromycin esterase family protein [Thermoanaerobaculia bacterium]|nr:erythromycin esterase family protein [Thermoanaerobaculia bacterium]